MKERDVVIDIDSHVDTTQQGENPDHSNESIDGENSLNLSNTKTINGMSPNSGKNTKKEKRKSTSAKKPPRPPRPPRGLSLDLADHKLIKEISELAMIKRARIERMKALKKTKAIKALSVSASSSGNIIAMVFTVLFCIVIIFQGCHSSGISPMHSSAMVNPGSPNSNEASPISIHDQPNLMELVSGSDNKDGGRRMLDK